MAYHWCSGRSRNERSFESCLKFLADKSNASALATSDDSWTDADPLQLTAAARGIRLSQNEDRIVRSSQDLLSDRWRPGVMRGGSRQQDTKNYRLLRGQREYYHLETEHSSVQGNLPLILTDRPTVVNKPQIESHPLWRVETENHLLEFIYSFIHSFILSISVAPLQGDYTQERSRLQ